ncbi:Hypothetical protein Ccan_18330 [Capnocytophaga canimorsus Cc5]|uniref:Uncharacterized protein n=1 Tax=Capnocytophaga canimorsus (strain 5) TaxID=860228 RepID=F9YSV4_CAPCC|nr:Hypothetical protein Ccan_18330 [Capnocytophaga canimorsus Cc5]CEN50249.1 conserved hypothetical protein [Capnocytophaga canimorsus]
MVKYRIFLLENIIFVENNLKSILLSIDFAFKKSLKQPENERNYPRRSRY